MSCPRFNIDGASNITLSNIGGGAGVFAQRVGDDFQLNSLVAGPGIQITTPVGQIVIESTVGAAATLQSAYDNGQQIDVTGNGPVIISDAGGAQLLEGLTLLQQSNTGSRVLREVNSAPLTLPAGGNLVVALPPLPNGNFLATIRVLAQSASGPETFEIRVAGFVAAGVHTLSAPPQINSFNNLIGFPAGLNATVVGGASLQVTLTGGLGNPAAQVAWATDILYYE